MLGGPVVGVPGEPIPWTSSLVWTHVDDTYKHRRRKVIKSSSQRPLLTWRLLDWSLLRWLEFLQSLLKLVFSFSEWIQTFFSASPPCVFAEFDSDGLLDWGTLGNGVSWQRREVCSAPSLWATAWPDAHHTSSKWPQPPQHKQLTAAERPKRNLKPRGAEVLFKSGIKNN